MARLTIGPTNQRGRMTGYNSIIDNRNTQKLLYIYIYILLSIYVLYIDMHLYIETHGYIYIYIIYNCCCVAF